MKNGAYGAFAGVDSLERTLSFSTYRDPRAVSSFALFKAGLEEFASSMSDERDFERAVVSAVGRDLRPYAPGERGFVAFKRALYGISDVVRQKRRDELLSVTRDEINKYASELFKRFDSAVSVLIDASENAALFARSRPDGVSHELPS
jgi:presequence protease